MHTFALFTVFALFASTCFGALESDWAQRMALTFTGRNVARTTVGGFFVDYLTPTPGVTTCDWYNWFNTLLYATLLADKILQGQNCTNAYQSSTGYFFLAGDIHQCTAQHAQSHVRAACSQRCENPDPHQKRRLVGGRLLVRSTGNSAIIGI